MSKEYIEREKVIEVIKNYGKNAIDIGQSSLDPVDDILLLQGAVNMIPAADVIVPPCKVGDTVYVVSQGQGFCMRWNVYEGKVVDIHLNRHNKLTIRVENGEKFFGYFDPCFIHKTKEEAEKALAERSVDNELSV